jgi:hypothetical protein
MIHLVGAILAFSLAQESEAEATQHGVKWSIPWVTSLEAAQQEAQKDGRLIWAFITCGN